VTISLRLTIQVRRLELSGLRANRPLRVRVCCSNGEGASHWGETLELHTPSPGGGGGNGARSGSDDAPVAVPKSWLRLPIDEVLLEHLRDNGGATPEDFLVELGRAVRPHVTDIRRVFRMYAASHSGGGGDAHMPLATTAALTALQFGRFARDAGLHTGTNPGRNRCQAPPPHMALPPLRAKGALRFARWRAPSLLA